MVLDEEILNFLNRDRIKNINIISFIENNPIHYMERFKDSVIVKGKSDENWVYISSSSKEELKALLKKCKDDEFFAAVEDWMLPLIVENKGIAWKLSCMKLIFPEEKELPSCKYKAEELTADDAEYIYNNSKYKDYTSIEYIADRIKNGIGMGIYDEDKLVAWIMTHDDGAMGFLNVLSEYRKKGYGYDLAVNMMDRLRCLGKIPFAHIEEDNYKSMNLSLKAGFVKDRRVHWVRRKEW